jgi:oligoribonuclease NrnB/cAMP/cGMP phosphodiesterase (DHH superfamily)
MKILCIYHGKCADGFGAALAVKHYCDKSHYDCEFIAANHGDNPPNVTGKHVIIVDFSYPRKKLLIMKEQSKTLKVFDHHKTAQEDLAGLDFCCFDMNKSGAVLTWTQLMPNAEIPLLFSYIQDRDLWLWKMQDSKTVSAAIQALPMTFEQWEYYMDNDKIPDLVTKGTAIVAYQKQQLERQTSAENILMVNIAGYEVPCINTTHLVSEIGNKISAGYPFAAMYMETPDKRIYSLRSSAEGIDVSVIAKKFGGGGHFHAAGFSVDKPEINLSVVP